VAKAKKKPNAGKALTAEKREKMFQVYFKHGTVQSVIKECTIHKTTANKYKKVDGWEHRAEEIRREAVKTANKKNASQVVKSLNLAMYTLKKLMEEIEKDGVESKSKVHDLDKLLRLIEFLGGSPDSRPDVPRGTITDIEELKLLLQQKKQQLSNFNSKSK